ncbi:MAG: peroxiredoxin family protein [Gemmatimonadaceae bacterium]
MSTPLEPPVARAKYANGVAPWVLVVLLVVGLVSIALKNHALRSEFLDYRRAELRIRRGSFVPPFTGSATNGRPLFVGKASSNFGLQFLIILTSTCPFCKQSLPAWKEIYLTLDTAKLPATDMVALTTDSLRVAKVYAGSNDLPFPLVSFPSRAYRYAYKGSLVPQIVLVDSGGRVVFARSGPLNTRVAIDSVLAAVRKGPPQPVRRALKGPSQVSN